MKNTKFNRFTQYHSDVTHASFGIQNWLVKKGYVISSEDEYKVDKLKYKALLKAYYEKYRYLDDNLFDENGDWLDQKDLYNVSSDISSDTSASFNAIDSTNDV